MVRGEDDAPTVRMEEGGEVRRTVVRDLALARTVGVHDIDLQAYRAKGAFFEQRLEIGELGHRAGMMRAIDDALAIAGEEGAAVITGRARQTPDVATVGIHDVDVGIAIAHRGEDDLLPIRGDRGLRIIAGRIGELPQIGAVHARREDVVLFVERPHVAARAIRRRGTIRTDMMRRGVDDAIPLGEEVGAGRAPLSRTDQTNLVRLQVQDEDLIAKKRRARGLKDELPSIGGEVGLGVLAAESELADVGQVAFLTGEEQAARFGGVPLLPGRRTATDARPDQHKDESARSDLQASSHGSFPPEKLLGPMGCSTPAREAPTSEAESLCRFGDHFKSGRTADSNPGPRTRCRGTGVVACLGEVML